MGAGSSGGVIVRRPTPKLGATPLPIVIGNPKSAPPAKIYPVGTPEFRYWVTAEAARRGADYWGGLEPKLAWNSQVGSKLSIDTDAGKDLNAFYDRNNLSFFHFPFDALTIYSAASPDVVCHELGHAVLDAIKPQLWDAASLEAGAFHESFGDMSAILSALQLENMRHDVLNDTGGVLSRSSNLSRLAEQLGWGIRQLDPTAVDPDCLRNAVNRFFYADPDTLPSRGPASSLSSEVHSFSRVFTGAFFEGLAGMFKARPAQDEENLLQVSHDMGRILVDGIKNASVVPNFYSEVAANILAVADSQFAGSGYREALNSAFVRHGIIPPAFGMALAAPRAAAVAAVAGGGGGELSRQNLSVAEYGLNVNSIVVFAADQPRQFDVAGAAAAVGAVAPPASNDAAKAFFEDLLRQGRINVSAVATPRAAITRAAAPTTHDTFTHELRPEADGTVTLRRLRIDCGFHV